MKTQVEQKDEKDEKRMKRMNERMKKLEIAMEDTIARQKDRTEYRKELEKEQVKRV